VTEPADTVRASIHIDAAPARVFAYFTEPTAMVQWMGEFAELDPRPGGIFAVDIEGEAVRGRFLELEPPHRLLFTWGRAGSERMPAGSTTVEVWLRAEAGGTRVDLVHRDLPDDEAPKHERGWDRFLVRLATVG
jgi:uncharacterized protein YndB with AHSA1/START domain